jgi:GMP synthase-like glutamine amidotransferase
MRIACIQHVSFEGPANIARWATARGHTLREIHVYRGDVLPSVETFDLLVLMGGPMSVNDEDRFAWLAPEKELVRAALQAGRHMLGVCLGAQMIASALGARVYRNSVKEIGWFPIESVPGEAADALGVSVWPLVFHWHGETFDLPAGAVLAARSQACANQAFLYQRRALALQFHIEVTPESAALLIQHAGHEIGTGSWEQPAETLLDAPQRFRHLEPVLFEVLDRFVAMS